MCLVIYIIMMIINVADETYMTINRQGESWITTYITNPLHQINTYGFIHTVAYRLLLVHVIVTTAAIFYGDYFRHCESNDSNIQRTPNKRRQGRAMIEHAMKEVVRAIDDIISSNPTYTWRRQKREHRKYKHSASRYQNDASAGPSAHT